jgi:hypothetical protein
MQIVPDIVKKDGFIAEIVSLLGNEDERYPE